MSGVNPAGTTNARRIIPMRASPTPTIRSLSAAPPTPTIPRSRRRRVLPPTASVTRWRISWHEKDADRWGGGRRARLRRDERGLGRRVGRAAGAPRVARGGVGVGGGRLEPGAADDRADPGRP